MSALSKRYPLLSDFHTKLDTINVSEFTPLDFRLAIANQVEKDNLPMAEALGEAGLSLYPDAEDVLVMAALLAELREDWVAADEYLEQLVERQKQATPPTTWRHWIRVLRCNGEPAKAFATARKALAHYPEDAALRSEYLDLLVWLGGSVLAPGSSLRQ